MKTRTLSKELSVLMDAYWRAANYLSVGQIDLYDKPLPISPFGLPDIKHLLKPKRLAQASLQRHSLITSLPHRESPRL